jgi:hypothetical protein
MDPVAETLAQAVDAEFYRHVYGELPAGISAAGHYATRGWLERRDPNPWFSTQDYVENNADVAESGAIPLFHFLEKGASEGRHVARSRHANEYYAQRLDVTHPARQAVRFAAPEALGGEFARQWYAVRDEFDAGYYLAVNSDVAQAGMDPLEHFLLYGWREMRDPSFFFSTKTYLERNHDVAESGVNPFYHYISQGRREGRADGGRLAVQHGAGRLALLARQDSMRQQLANVPRLPRWKIGVEDRLRAALRAMVAGGAEMLYVSVSHDDYTANVGGMQVCLAREADAFAREGFDHIHLFPASVRYVTDNEGHDPVLGVLLNGSFGGFFAADAIAGAVESAFEGVSARPACLLVIHSLLGHNVESLAIILRAFRLGAGFFWIHDYASVCAGLNLLRNNIEYCGGPPAASVSCDVCLYGDRRRAQVADHEFMFREFGLIAVAPSQSALEVWKATSRFATAGEIVHPHCRLIPSTLAPSGTHRRSDVPIAVPLRVAFLGLPAPHKGWLVFRDLLLLFARDVRYEFFHFARESEPGAPVTLVKVVVGPGNLNAMTTAIEEYQIDVAVIWSLWPETFCFTAYEAIAGGAALVASACSGNVAQLVRDTGKGVVAANDRDLFDLFETGDILAWSRSLREDDRPTLRYSALTADLVTVGTS